MGDAGGREGSGRRSLMSAGASPLSQRRSLLGVASPAQPFAARRMSGPALDWTLVALLEALVKALLMYCYSGRRASGRRVRCDRARRHHRTRQHGRCARVDGCVEHRPVDGCHHQARHLRSYEVAKRTSAGKLQKTPPRPFEDEPRREALSEEHPDLPGGVHMAERGDPQQPPPARRRQDLEGRRRAAFPPPPRRVRQRHVALALSTCSRLPRR